jgi:DHA2 family multidrug resistance protein-like MFS transporter
VGERAGAALEMCSSAHFSNRLFAMTDTAAHPVKRLAALTVALAVTVSALDGVMLNATLPTIAAQLRADPHEAIWVVNAYQLAAAIVLLPLGKAADIFGHKRIYLGCVLLFGFGSLGSSLAHDLPTLAVWRFLQGCGGAGIMGITNAMLRYVYPPRSFALGVARNSMLVAIALAIGPSLASIIVTFAGWRWLFLVNLPVVLLLLAIGIRTLPPGDRSAHRFDWPSAVFSMASFGLILIAVDAGAHGAAMLLPAMLAAGGLGAAGLLLRRQRGMAMPLLPVDLLRTHAFGLSVACMFVASAAQLIAYIGLPFLFQQDLGRSQIETGLLFLPWPIALAVTAPLAVRLAGRVDPSRQCALGLAVMATGLATLAMLGAGATTLDIVWRMALCGIGYGLFQPANSRTMMLSAPDGRLGSASVMGASARVMGQAIGAAVAAMLFRMLPDDGRVGALGVAALFAVAGVGFSLGRDWFGVGRAEG